MAEVTDLPDLRAGFLNLAAIDIWGLGNSLLELGTVRALVGCLEAMTSVLWKNGKRSFQAKILISKGMV